MATTSGKDAVQHQQRTGFAHQAARTGCGRPAGELHGAEGLISNQGALARFLLLLRPRAVPPSPSHASSLKNMAFPTSQSALDEESWEKWPHLALDNSSLPSPAPRLTFQLPSPPSPLFSSHHCPRHFTIQKLKDCSPQSHKHNNYTSNFPQI